MVISSRPKQVISYHHPVTQPHTHAELHQRETWRNVREIRGRSRQEDWTGEEQGPIGGTLCMVPGPGRADQHFFFLKRSLGACWWSGGTRGRWKGQIQPGYTFIECFVEKHPWHTPRLGSSVCHAARGTMARPRTWPVWWPERVTSSTSPCHAHNAALHFGKCSLSQ